MPPTSSQASEAIGTRSWFKYPNAFYQLIAIICIIMLFVEVAGYLKGDGVKVAVLVGLALLALLAPNIESLTIGKDGVIAALKSGIDENSNKIDDTKNAAREIDAQLDQKVTQIFQELSELKKLLAEHPHGTDGGASVALADTFELPPVIYENDPQKGRFGGNEQSNGRVICAQVATSSVNSNWCSVRLSVAALPSNTPLMGRVDFFLHGSFQPDHFVVQAANGEAVLNLRAWGAFTVGAIADGGHTTLELDLATSPNVAAPDEWRRR